ncbi:hypothetical protein ACIA47_25215 [Micromonospora sp. NPDC051227]
MDIGPAEADVVAPLFFAVPAATSVESVEALGPWLARVEPGT